MNNRLKEIDLIVEQFFPQKNYENEKIDKINKFKLKYKDELKNYNIINTKEELYNLNTILEILLLFG